MRRIAVINQKGGVGKTTTTVNLGVALARAGHRVLMLDLDPQAHLSLHLGLDPAAKRPGVYEMLTGSASIAKARVKVGPNMWVCASSIDLAAAEVELVSVVGREVILKDLLDQHVGAQAGRSPQYDYVLMDCPPSLGVLTLNGLCAAGEVFIPLQPHYLALQGLGKLLETVSLVNRRINPNLAVSGVVVCMHDAGTRLAAEVVDDVRKFFDGSRGAGKPWSQARVFESFIRRNIKLAECPSYGQSIFDYAPDSNGAKDYELLGKEVHSAAPVTAAAAPAVAPAEAAPVRSAEPKPKPAPVAADPANLRIAPPAEPGAIAQSA
jgi:chromosome partitioning protein